MKRLILHVGTHKTGTTAIQHFLYADRARLAQAGVLYAPCNDLLGGVRYAQHGVAHALSRYDAADREALETYRGRLLDTPADTILISAEPFYRHFDQSSGGDQNAHACFSDLRAAYLDRVAEYFAPFQTEVSIYFRRPDHYATSLYKENITSTNLTEKFDTYLTSSPRTSLFRYQDRLAELQKRFEKVAVHSFEEACKIGLVDAFYEHHGLPRPEAVDAPDAMRSGIPERATLWLVRSKQATALDVRDRERRWTFALSDDGQQLFQSAHKEMFWQDDAARLAFVKQSLDGFAYRDFWTLNAGTAQPVQWSDEDQERANRAFEDWAERNAAQLHARETQGVSPYMVDAKVAPERGAVLTALFGLLSRFSGRRSR